MVIFIWQHHTPSRVTTMDNDSYKELEQLCTTCNKWKAILPLTMHDGTEQNLCILLTPCPEYEKYLKEKSNYPGNTWFRFPSRYKGKDAKVDLVKAIQQQARNSGCNLPVFVTKFKTSSSRVYSITFWFHYGRLYKGNQKAFSEDMIRQRSKVSKIITKTCQHTLPTNVWQSVLLTVMRYVHSQLLSSFPRLTGGTFPTGHHWTIQPMIHLTTTFINSKFLS